MNYEVCLKAKEEYLPSSSLCPGDYTMNDIEVQCTAAGLM
jgi:hypothetical protein